MKDRFKLRQAVALMYGFEGAGIVMFAGAVVALPTQALGTVLIIGLAAAICISVSMMFHTLSALIEMDDKLEQLVKR